MNERKVPGLWQCPKCNCTLGKFSINAITGNVGVPRDAPTPPECPNKCGAMNPVMELLQ